MGLTGCPLPGLIKNPAPHPHPLTHSPHAHTNPAQALCGDKGFLTKVRLAKYSDKRNDPAGEWRHHRPL